MKKALALLLVLIFVFCGILTSCEDNGESEKTKSSKTESQNSDDPKDGKDTGYTLVGGASSEWELYKAVINYLNNGFRYDDIKNLYDPMMCLVYESKSEENPEQIFTLGMDLEESCDLFVRLRNAAKNMDYLTDDYGQIDMDYIDYAKFIKEFPAELRSKLSEDDEDFVKFIKQYVLSSDELFERLYADGSNWFGSDQTHWDTMSKTEFDKLEKKQYSYYREFDKDLFNNFPRIYEISLGEYTQGHDAFDMRFEYAEVEGRYYFLCFGATVGGIGG